MPYVLLHALPQLHSLIYIHGRTPCFSKAKSIDQSTIALRQGERARNLYIDHPGDQRSHPPRLQANCRHCRIARDICWRLEAQSQATPPSSPAIRTPFIFTHVRMLPQRKPSSVFIHKAPPQHRREQYTQSSYVAASLPLSTPSGPDAAAARFEPRVETNLKHKSR